jgi:hypothetical protein
MDLRVAAGNFTASLPAAELYVFNPDSPAGIRGADNDMRSGWHAFLRRR